jgi:predicted amidophosphoribosyltransferase
MGIIPRDALFSQTLLRTRATPPQAEVKGEDARRANVAECFKVPAPADVRGKNIVLFDDVATSGATLTEAARVLKLAGAKNIIGFVVAKA